MKEEILRLREEGKTYNEIKSILGCSKGTISFHCGEGQKEKNKKRTRANRKIFKNYISRRIKFFQKRDNDNRNYDSSKPLTFTFDDFINKFGIDTKCALSGTKINMKEDRNWEIDHIVPISKGGDNSLQNCQILLKDINIMKGGLTEIKLLEYCKMIINNIAR